MSVDPVQTTVRNRKAAERSRVLFDDDAQVDFFEDIQERETLALLREERQPRWGYIEAYDV
jgi:hypothetical protein